MYREKQLGLLIYMELQNRLKQRDHHEFEASLGCTVKACPISFFSKKCSLLDNKPITGCSHICTEHLDIPQNSE